MGAHDELPSIGLAQKLTTSGDYFFCHATIDCNGLDVGYMEVQDRETLAVKKYRAHGYIDVDFDAPKFRDLIRLWAAALLGYCLDSMYHSSHKDGPRYQGSKLAVQADAVNLARPAYENRGAFYLLLLAR